MPPDQLVTIPGSGAAPYTYAVAPAQELILKAAFAVFNGAAAASAFYPCLRIISPSGQVVGEYTAQTTVAAGGSAEVTFAPFLGSGGGGAAQAGVQVRVPVLETPDSSGNAFPSLTTSNGFTNVRRLLPYFAHTGDGYWTGTVRIPRDFSSNAQIVVSGVVNATTGVVRLIVGTAVVAAGVSEDTNYTDEAAQNVTVPGTLFQRFDTTFNLSTSPVAGSDLNVRVKRNAANAADTCTALFGVWAAVLEYTSA